jgi:hypothetical protein
VYLFLRWKPGLNMSVIMEIVTVAGFVLVVGLTASSVPRSGSFGPVLFVYVVSYAFEAEE